jgi:hypothetical protein
MIAMMRYRKYPGTLIHHTVIVGVALIYVALSVMSAGCMFTYAQEVLNDHQHHSHDGSSPQNAFCAWACQATTDVGVGMVPSLAVVERVLWRDNVLLSGLIPCSSLSSLHSRAPPLPLFVRLG